MSIVKAFIGHSFTEDDKILNNTFLEYFDLIKSMNFGFIWEHAKAAEPKELAEKVINLIRDKNLFVGICTKKECVIGFNELERCWIKRKFLRGNKTKFLWKTSDWIIQEIGLAIGREMDLILLTEEGLRHPGGLQGNIEYIEFNRQNPERSFGKILEMIRALIPKTSIAPIQELGAASSENAAPEEEKKENDNWWLEPKPEWNKNLYCFALMNSIEAGDSKAEEKITSAFLKSPDVCGTNSPANWEALSLYLRILYGKGGKLDEMEKFASEKPEIEKVHYYLGKAYEIYKEHKKAGQAFKCAADHAENSEDRLNDLGKAAVAFFRGSMKLEYEEIIAKMKQEVLYSCEGEKSLISTLIEIANIESDMDVFYGLAERLLELTPDDNENRFTLAYKYSLNDEDKLSFYHYLRIPEPNRGGVTWNNLGVQYSFFQLACSSVRSYRKAEETGDTLAISNIANKFIGSGFLSEAKNICNKALKIEGCHKNVNLEMARIKEKPEEERKKEEEIIKETIFYSEFYKNFGKALCRPNPNNYSGEWEGPKCGLHLEIRDRNFVAKGTYDPSMNRPERSNLSLASVNVPSELSRKRVVKYMGMLSGYSIIKAVMTDEEDICDKATSPQKLFGLTDKIERSVFMYISDSFNEICVLDKKGTESQKIYTLIKLSDSQKEEFGDAQ